MMFLHKTPLTFHHHVHVKVCYSSVLQDGAELLRELSRADDARLLRRPAAEHEGPAEGMKTWVSKKLKITQTFLKISLSVIVVLCFSNSYMLLEYSTWPPPPLLPPGPPAVPVHLAEHSGEFQVRGGGR